MIVVDQPNNTWRIVHQFDHAATSGQMARRWRRPTILPEEVWPELVEAIARHDEGWREAETAPALDGEGRPHDFKSLPAPEHLAVWRAGIDELEAETPYAALIVALHARWLYTHVGHTDPEHAGEVQAFLEQLDQWVETTVAQLGEQGNALRQAVQPGCLEIARRLLTLLDAMSLMLAGALPVRSLDETLAFGDVSCPVQLSELDGGKGAGLAVGPWPFEGEPFEVEMLARHVPQRVYDSPAELAAALEASEPEALRYWVTWPE